MYDKWSMHELYVEATFPHILLLVCFIVNLPAILLLF